jgi:hypothetical protein
MTQPLQQGAAVDIETTTTLGLDDRERRLDKKWHQAEGKGQSEANAIRQAEESESIGKLFNPGGRQKQGTSGEKGAKLCRHAKPEENPFPGDWEKRQRSEARTPAIKEAPSQSGKNTNKKEKDT